MPNLSRVSLPVASACSAMRNAFLVDETSSAASQHKCEPYESAPPRKHTLFDETNLLFRRLNILLLFLLGLRATVSPRPND